MAVDVLDPCVAGTVAMVLTMLTGLILGLRQVNERRRYFVTPSLIGWAQI